MSSSLSHTAAYIAVKFYGLTLNPKINQRFDPFLTDFYKNIVQFLPKHLSWNSKALQSQRWRSFFVRWEEFLLPGDLMHILARKYYIHELLQKEYSINKDFQLVILGSGFDHLGAYWSKKGIPCFEIDTPKMIANKNEFLTEFGYMNDHLNLSSIQNGQSLSSVLNQKQVYNPDTKTLFIAEGFFDYLSLKLASSIIEEISKRKHSVLISTFFDLSELNFFHRFVFTSGVAVVGESLKLPLNKYQFIKLLENHKFKLKTEISYNSAKKNLINSFNIPLDLPVLKGFYIQHYNK